MPLGQVEAFLSKVGAPLAIGTIEIEDGSRARGFLREAHGAGGAHDISSLGGWRSFLRSGSNQAPPA